MKVVIEFDAKTPGAAVEVLTAIRSLIKLEYNPRQWKRPTEFEVTANVYSEEKRIVAKVRIGERREVGDGN